MKTNKVLKIATIIALMLAVGWSIVVPSFEPFITVITLSIAFFSLHRQESESLLMVENNIEGFIAIDGGTYPGAKKSIHKISYDSRIKVWELLEIIEQYLPQAIPSEYGKSWALKNAQSGVTLSGLDTFVREKCFLEEEARSLLHIGLGPNTTLQIIKIN